MIKTMQNSRSRLVAFAAAAMLILPGLLFTAPAQAKKLNWNEIQECIYLPFDMAQVRKDYALDRQAERLPVLINQYETQCIKGQVAKRDYEVVCSLPTNFDTAFCTLLRQRFVRR